MRRKQINAKEASVGATFYEPAYQRLRLWHRGEMVDLLCFLRGTSDSVRQLMEQYGANPSHAFRTTCFSEVWELPHETLRHSSLGKEAATFDQELVEKLGCNSGQFSGKCGYLRWQDNAEDEHRRSYAASILLEESARKQTRWK